MTGTVKITILKDTVCGGKPVAEGDIVDAGEADARLLKNLGKARETTDDDLKKTKKAKKATGKPGTASGGGAEDASSDADDDEGNAGGEDNGAA